MQECISMHEGCRPFVPWRSTSWCKGARKQGRVFHELLMPVRFCRDGKGVTIQRDGFPGSVVMLFLVGPWMVISFALRWPLIGKIAHGSQL